MLRAALRQDPDVIMVGEIRDLETATMAMQASITGHLVISTMHTNSAVATITRLKDFGIPSYLVASALSGVIAQRLVRTICSSCKTKAPFDESELAQLGIRGLRHRAQGYVGAGCNECNGTGYRGRNGVFEVLTMNAALRETISSGGRDADLWRGAMEGGMSTLLSGGLTKVKEGVTTVSELLRSIGPGEDHVAHCPSCGEAVDKDFRACLACQHKLSSACPTCHKALSPSWNLCPYCCTVVAAQETGVSTRARVRQPREKVTPAAAAEAVLTD